MPEAELFWHFGLGFGFGPSFGLGATLALGWVFFGAGAGGVFPLPVLGFGGVLFTAAILHLIATKDPYLGKQLFTSFPRQPEPSNKGRAILLVVRRVCKHTRLRLQCSERRGRVSPAELRLLKAKSIQLRSPVARAWFSNSRSGLVGNKKRSSEDLRPLLRTPSDRVLLKRFPTMGGVNLTAYAEPTTHCLERQDGTRSGISRVWRVFPVSGLARMEGYSTRQGEILPLVRESLPQHKVTAIA